MKRSAVATRTKSGGGVVGKGYLAESTRPLVILAFLTPFVILHELGSRLYHTEVAAFTILRMLSAYLGVYGRGVPPLLLVLTLLAWHLWRRDRWRIDAGALPLMAGESLLFSLPIFGISVLCRQLLPLVAVSKPSLGAMWALSLGAGVYEELVFRLYLCALLTVVAQHVFALKGTACTITVVIACSVLFSLYHYLGQEGFTLYTFLFRAAAGAYFAALLAARGYGITAGAHAFYDVIAVSLSRS